MSVQGYDPRPSIMIKASDNPDLPFRRFGFVEAIKELDPVGSLGLLAPDFKVRSPMLVSVGVQFWFFEMDLFLKFKKKVMGWKSPPPPPHTNLVLKI